jgi:hypothetical protein
MMRGMDGADFSAGSVLERSFGIFGKHFVPFFVLAAIAYVPVIAFQEVLATGTQASNAMQNLVQMVSGLVAQGAVAYGVFQALRGTPAGLGQCITVGLQRLLPVLGVALVTGFAVAFGVVLLVVPGLILMTVLYVAVPVAVIEKPGVGRSLSRSQELTAGYRWSIFGVLLLIVLINLGVAILLEKVLGPSTFTVWLGHGLAVVVTALSGVTAAVTYHDLRVVKEGVSSEQLAGVFD